VSRKIFKEIPLHHSAMITKIRELMQLKENVDSLNQQLVEHNDTVQKLTVHIDEFKNAMETMSADASKLATNMSKETTSLHSFQEQLEHELYEFKLTQKEVRDRFHKNMEQELGWLKAAMLKDVNEYNDLKKRLDTKLQTVDKLDAEVQRLTSISKMIKAQDFELVRFQKELARKEEEKIRLLKKIDGLERLVAKMRKR
jgi:chromosome segregation ATPase